MLNSAAELLDDDPSFVHDLLSPRVLFGAETSKQLAAEIDRLSGSRAFVLTTARGSKAFAKATGDIMQIAGVFAGARMHTPRDVTHKAMQLLSSTQADCLVSFGGGSSIGLAKSLALRTGLPHLSIPTTYSGSEMTSVVGETTDGQKRTTKHECILPKTVIYDVSNTLGLSARTTVTSAMNAIAHGVEVLYAENGNPLLSIIVEAGIANLVAALAVLPANLGDTEARHRALYGAWLCGMGLNAAGMALHHKLCHVIGGSFDLPHAETHTIVLPHAISYNAGATPKAFARMQAAIGAKRPQDRLRELASIKGVPSSLRELGMPREGIAKTVEMTLQAPYWNPRPLEKDALLALVSSAWSGDRPA